MAFCMQVQSVHFISSNKGMQAVYQCHHQNHSKQEAGFIRHAKAVPGREPGSAGPLPLPGLAPLSLLEKSHLTWRTVDG